MKTLRNLRILSACIFFISCAGEQHKNAFFPEDMLVHCVEKTEKTMAGLAEADQLPRNVLQGQTEWNKVGVHDWTSGFWPGVLWYAYEASGNEQLREGALKFTHPLTRVLDFPVCNHDLGFMFYCSAGNALRLTGDPIYNEILIRAADSLMTLFNPKVGTILSWPAMREKMNWPHNTIIDNMINLELLFWASKNTGDKKYYNVAVKHAEITMNTLIRPDFTTYHVAVFDTVDGQFIKGVTHQGYADNSFWARGQGWGIYGFTMAYRETGNEQFLEAAKKMADVFLDRLPEDGIPYWDFEDPAIPDAPKDASAAAITTSAMLELSTFMKDETLKAKYKDAAMAMLELLSSDDYLSKDKNQAFLLHSTGHYPRNSEINASIIYADYYFIEALLRLNKFYGQ